MKKTIQTCMSAMARLPRRGVGRLLALTTGGALAISGVAGAATATWDGGGGDDSWSTSDNWLGDVAPISGDDLVFAGSDNLLTFNDLDSAGGGTFDVASITFAADAESFELDGTAIAFEGKTITSLSPADQFVFAQLEAGSTNGFTIDTEAYLYLDDIYTPTWGRVLVKDGPGKCEIGMSNDSWEVILNEGTLESADGNLFVQRSNPVQVNGGTLSILGSSTLHHGATVNLNNTTGTSVLAVGGGITIEFDQLNGASGSSVTNWGTTGQTATVNLDGSGENSGFSGSITDGAGGGATAIVIDNGATATLSGASTHTGGTTVGGGSALTLTSTGSLLFSIQPGGVSNKVSGGGSATFDGTFNFDLSGVGSPSVGDAWVISEVTSAGYGSNFAVGAPFAETPVGSGTWTYFDGVEIYYFGEAVGTLSYGVPPVAIWDGGGADDNFSTAANWVGDTAPASGLPLLFNGTTRLTPFNDYNTTIGGTHVLGNISFGDTAGTFAVTGTAMNLTGKTVTNEGASTQTINAVIQVDSAPGTGITFDAAAGDIVADTVHLIGGFSDPFNKIGPETLTVNNVVFPETFQGNVNEGTLVMRDKIFFNAVVAAGATLRCEHPDVIHNGGDLTLNGTLLLNQNSTEDVDVLEGSGVVSSWGTSGTSYLQLRNSANKTFSGSIQDGPSAAMGLIIGGISGTAANTFTLSGTNTYSGDTTFANTDSSLTLASTGTLRFAAWGNGVNTQVKGLQAGGALTSLDGTFSVDVSAADLTNGNSWELVDASDVNESYGATFQVVNANYAPGVTTRVNCGDGTYGSFGEDDGFVSGGGNFSDFGSTVDLSGLTDPAPQEVYQTERYGDSTYTFTGLGPNAGYTVRLHFAELFWGGTGQRVFDVLINGVTVLEDYDIVAAAGSVDVGVIEELPVNADLSGIITIAFVTEVDNAKVSGIEIIPDGSGSSANFAEGPAGVWTMVDGANTWTFSESNSVLSLSTGGGSGFSDWVSSASFGLDLADQDPDDDPDGDGFTNCFEYAVAGMNPAVADASPGSFDGSTLSFTKRALAVANGDVSYAIHTSRDLGQVFPWAAVTPDVNDGTTISYTFSFAFPADYARLVITK